MRLLDGGGRMKISIILTGLVVVLAACTTAPAAPTVDLNAINTLAIKTAGAPFTQTAQAVIVNSTGTARSVALTQAVLLSAQQATAASALMTQVMASLPTPGPTVSPLLSPKTDGHFLINVDIAPGVWRSDGSQSDCYWEVTTATGDIISNDFGMAGGTAYIPPTGFEVTWQNCGTWTYLQAP